MWSHWPQRKAVRGKSVTSDTRDLNSLKSFCYIKKDAANGQFKDGDGDEGYSLKGVIAIVIFTTMSTFVSITRTHPRVSAIFLKNGQSRASFFVYFRLFKQTLQFLQQINVKKVHLLYCAGI